MSDLIIARSVRGLEWVLADEIAQRLPAARDLALTPREIAFRLPALDPGVHDLRTADDAFLVVGTVSDVGRTKDVPPAAGRRIAELDWVAALSALGGLRPVRSPPLFDVVVSLEGRRNFSRFDLENATGDALVAVLGGRHLARTAGTRPDGVPDLTVRLFVRGPDVTVALRLANRPLHRRAYKIDTGPGTLHPPVAAALARLAGVTAADVVADPFCGDATVAVEAALTCPGVRVEAADVDPGRLVNAARNVARAGVAVDLECRDAARTPTDGRITALLTNPPWNVAVDAQGMLTDGLDAFWERLEGVLAPAGRYCLVADAELDAPGLLRGLGHRLAVAVRVRLAGRVVHLVLGTTGAEPPDLPPSLTTWRTRAQDAGVVAEDGF